MYHPRRVLFGFLSLVLLLSFSISAIAKDEWLQVRSKNFFLVGNASEKDIRKVGQKLEQFRETFRLVFANTKLVASIPTNVIVFKSDSAFKPFKPRRSDGKADNFIAGYFQSGADANYIAVSAEGDDTQMYNTIFHEYVHFIINTNFPKSEVPQWFNEGLAEYYSTFAIENDQIAKLGLPDSNHLYLLQQSKLIPLDQLFKVSNRQLHAQGGHSRSIFYAESWALVHYLIQSNKDAGLSKYLNAVINGTPEDKAFQDAFQIPYSQMEAELKKYVSKSSYQYHNITFKNKLDFDSTMQVAPYSEADTNARLGDLLYHTDRADEAEPFLTTAIKLDPDSSMANTTFGMVKIRQRKFDEAKQFLEKATALDQKNHMAFFQYAYLLSREGTDEFGYVRSFPADTAEKMRSALKHAIAIAPDFTESYELFAFVSVVNNDHLDEAATMLQRALAYQPGNERYAMRLAEIYLHQSKFDQATAIAEKFAQSDDDDVRQRAEHLKSEISGRKNYEQQLAEFQKRSSGTSGGGPAPVMRKREIEKPLSEEEVEKLKQAAAIRSINEALRQPENGEIRTLGYMERVDCKGGLITYQIKTEAGPMVLTSRDFQGVFVTSFVPAGDGVNFGCGANVSALYSLLTYREPANPKANAKGMLTSVEFVPKDFHLMTSQEMAAVSTPRPLMTQEIIDVPIVERSSPPPPAREETEGPPRESMKEMMLNNIRQNLREPGAGEKREMAFLQKIECTQKGIFFNMKTATSLLRLFDPSPESLPIKVFTPDLGGVRLDCNASILDFPAVVIYSDKPDSKLKSAGTILSIDFVPKSFTLN